MLSQATLDLDGLNQITQAWIEQGYNRERHEEIGQTPLERFLQGTDISRPAPESRLMDLAFTRKQTRRQRRSDGTLVIEGVRFEVPSRFQELENLSIRYVAWDLTRALLINPETDESLAVIHPLDKTKNAEGRRRQKSSYREDETPLTPDQPFPPLMRKYLAEYAVSGLPAAYLPLTRTDEEATDE